MQLKLVLEETGQSWTLKPNREYVIGSGSDCDIPLPHASVVSGHHLKFSFNQLANTWHVYDLGSSNGTFVDSQPVTDYPVKTQTRIAIAGGIFLVAIPVGNESTVIRESTASVPPPSLYSSPTPPPSSVPATQGASRPAVSEDPTDWRRRQRENLNSQARSPLARDRSSELKVLTWKEYVEKQVRKQPGWLSRLAVRFYMVTGFRNTPWVRRYGAVGFDAFDSYIIPDFKESAETVAIGIEKQLGQLRQYENTDCFVAKLTDAHIADSETQKFLGVELFPIIRGGRADYRRFCVVSYHRVRTYLSVENYGTDLFVSWITRFEPEPTPVIPGLWLGLLSLITLIILSATQGNLILSFIPLFLWLLIYMLVPRLMETGGILPKKSNSRLVIFCVLLLFGLFAPIFLLLLLLYLSQENKN